MFRNEIIPYREKKNRADILLSSFSSSVSSYSSSYSLVSPAKQSQLPSTLLFLLLLLLIERDTHIFFLHRHVKNKKKSTKQTQRNSTAKKISWAAETAESVVNICISFLFCITTEAHTHTRYSSASSVLLSSLDSLTLHLNAYMFTLASHIYIWKTFLFLRCASEDSFCMC